MTQLTTLQLEIEIDSLTGTQTASAAHTHMTIVVFATFWVESFSKSSNKLILIHDSNNNS